MASVYSSLLTQSAEAAATNAALDVRPRSLGLDHQGLPHEPEPDPVGGHDLREGSTLAGPSPAGLLRRAKVDRGGVDERPEDHLQVPVARGP